MNGAVLLAGGCVVFLLAYRFYGRLLEKIFGVEIDRQTPAVLNGNGVDYVPTRPSVLFGHHFASIAGAGPIVHHYGGAFRLGGCRALGYYWLHLYWRGA